MIYTFSVELLLVLEHRCVTKHYVIIQCSILLVIEHHCVAKHYLNIQCSIKVLVLVHRCYLNMLQYYNKYIAVL